MTTSTNDYIETVLTLYLKLPDTPSRLSRYDRRFAQLLCHRNVPLHILDAAFLIATARRLMRDPSYPPLNPIRSLNYFSPVIDELLAQPPSSTYIQYLRGKLAPHLSP